MRPVRMGQWSDAFDHPGDPDGDEVLPHPEPRPNGGGDPPELAGNLCRCTGYAPIVDSILAAAQALRG